MSPDGDRDQTSATIPTHVFFRNVMIVRGPDTVSRGDSPKSSILRRLIPRNPESINFRSHGDGLMDSRSNDHRINDLDDKVLAGEGGKEFDYKMYEEREFSHAVSQSEQFSSVLEERQFNEHSLDDRIRKGVRAVFTSHEDERTENGLVVTSDADSYSHGLDLLQLQRDARQEVIAGVDAGLILCNGTVGHYQCPDPTALTTSGTLSPDALTKIAVGAILVLIFVISITINIMVLFMFCRRKVRLTVSSRFLLNLTVCNMLTAVFILPVAFTSLVVQEWVFGNFWCHVTGFILNLVIAASTLTLIVISLDRYCAIVTPLHYHMKMTRKRSLQLVAAVWVVALVCALPPIFGWNHMEFQPRKMICTVKWTSHLKFDSYYNLFIVLLCFLVPLVALLWAYGVIFHAAKENSKRTVRRGSVHFSLTGQSAACAVLSNSSGLLGTSISAEASPALPSRRRSSSVPILGRRVSIQRLGNLLWYREERKTAVTCILIFMTFVACWSPYFAVIVVETFSQEDFKLPDFVDTVSIILAVSSCALDPLVYVLRNSQLRHEIYVMLRGEKINNTQLV